MYIDVSSISQYGKKNEFHIFIKRTGNGQVQYHKGISHPAIVSIHIVTAHAGNGGKLLSAR